MTPEAKLIEKTKRYLKTLPFCEFRKVHGNAFTASEPDLDIVYKSISIKAEAKAPKDQGGKAATPRQAARIREWRRAGAVAFVFRTVDEVRTVIEGIDRLFPYWSAVVCVYGEEGVESVGGRAPQSGER